MTTKAKTKTKKITYTDLMIHSSGEYLTENFPANYAEMDEEDVNGFIEEHIVQAYEYSPINEVFEMIDCGAEALACFLKSKGIKIVRD